MGGESEGGGVSEIWTPVHGLKLGDVFTIERARPWWQRWLAWLVPQWRGPRRPRFRVTEMVTSEIVVTTKD